MTPRSRLLLVACLALPLALAAAPLLSRLALPGTNYESIYGDVLGAKWQVYTWNCSGMTTSLTARPAGANGTAIEVNHSACAGGWGAFGVDRREANWWPSYPMDPAIFKAYTFRFNPGTDPTQIRSINVSLNLSSGGDRKQPLTRYLPAMLTPNTWYEVRIPVADLMATPVQFQRLLFNNEGPQRPRYYLDDFNVEWIGGVTAPVISGVTATPGPDNARLAWTTDKAAKGALTVTGGGTTKTVSETTFGTAHSLTVTGLQPSTAYTYTITARAQDADPSTPGADASVSGTFTTTARDVTPPVISNVQVTPTTNTATVAWATNEPADSRIEYGVSDYSLVATDTARKTAHSITLTGLTPGTTYKLRLKGTDAYGNTGSYGGSTLTFTTVAEPPSGPVAYETMYADALGARWLTGIWDCGGLTANLSARPAGANGTAIEVNHGACGGGWGAFGFDRRDNDWNKFYMQPHQFRAFVFRFNPGADVAQVRALHLFLDIPSTEGTNTEKPITNYLPNTLTPNTWYTVRVPVADLMATPTRFFRLYFFNKDTLRPRYYLDDVKVEWVSEVPAPVISNVTTPQRGPDFVRLTWATNILAKGALTVAIPGSAPRVITETAYTSAHGATLEGLLPGTTYSFTITAAAQVDDPAQTAKEARYDGTFTTGPADVTPPTFSDVKVQAFATRAVVTWKTNEAADSRAEYGKTDYATVVTDAKRDTMHTLTLTGLAPSTRYQVRLKSTDRFGNTGTYAPSIPLTFTTEAVPTATVAVDASRPTQPFRDGMRGMAFGNWTFFYGRPYPGDSPRARELTRLIRPGLFRYAGGLGSNMIAWDRNNSQQYPATYVDTDGDGTYETYSMRNDHRPLISGLDRCSQPAPFTKPDAYRWTYQAEEVDRLGA
ncbi:MAG TPA: fibronectin type III domain-containing protein, partial [Rhodothermales bacterium]|nr:fibronectin type III domain-containing protein [Rhodothermales bacterium]